MDLLEIEIKSYCETHGPVISRLESLGARFIEKRTEVDQYFNHPSRDFKQTDEALRVRVTGKKAILTYKGPKIGGQSKTRVEHECSVEGLELMKKILIPLGFVESGCVTKQRALYKLGPVEICLDDVSGAGTFVELEEKGTDREKIEAKLFELAGQLGLGSFTRTSYLEMVTKPGSESCHVEQ